MRTTAATGLPGASAPAPPAALTGASEAAAAPSEQTGGMGASGNAVVIPGLTLLTGSTAVGEASGSAVPASGPETKGAGMKSQTSPGPATPVAKATSPVANVASEAKPEESAEMQLLKGLVAQALRAKKRGHAGLPELERVLQALTYTKYEQVPLLPDLPPRVLRALDIALNRVSIWKADVIASGSPQGGSAPQQTGPSTVASDTAQSVPVASGPDVALATGDAVADAATQARTDGTAEMQCLKDLVEQARLAKDAGYTGLAELERILKELRHIKKVDVPVRPDLPLRVFQRLDTAITLVSRWRTKAAASGPTGGQQGSSAPPFVAGVAPQPKLDDMAEMQCLRDLVAQARMARSGGYTELAEIDRVFQTLVRIKEVEVPRLPDLSPRLRQALEDALKMVGDWRREVAASGPPEVSPAPQQAGPPKVAPDMDQTVPVACGPSVALATGDAVGVTAAPQTRPASAAPSATSNPTSSCSATIHAGRQANPVGTAEMLYLQGLVCEASKAGSSGAPNGLARLDGVLQELMYIKEVQRPTLPELPLWVFEAVDSCIDQVSRWRTGLEDSVSPRVAGPSGWVPASSSQQTSQPAVEVERSCDEDEMEWEPSLPSPAVGPIGPASTPLQAAAPVAGPAAAAPTEQVPTQLLLAEQPTGSAGPMAALQYVPAQQSALFAGPAVAASAPAPQQLLPQQQAVLFPPVVRPQGPQGPIVDWWKIPRPRAPLFDWWTPQYIQNTPLPPIEDDSALAPDAFMPKEKAWVVCGVRRRRAPEAAAPAPVMRPPVTESNPEPSPEAMAELLRKRLAKERRKLEEKRQSLYDAVFGAAAVALVATGLGLVGGLWGW